MGNSLQAVNLGQDQVASQIAVGYQHSCAILNNGNVTCWGRNDFGQAGRGDYGHVGNQANEMGDNLVQVAFGSGVKAVQLALGNFHTCVRTDDGKVSCWGYNAQGQLGTESTTNANVPPVTSIDLGTGRIATSIAAGAYHNCATRDDYSLVCWGYNNKGELGVSSTADVGDESSEMGDNLVVTDLANTQGQSLRQIVCGSTHTCAIRYDYSTVCWGWNLYGQLGLGHTDSIGDGENEMSENLVPIDFGQGRVATKLSAGYAHTCALFNTSEISCWGRNNHGQLGLNNTENIGDESGELGDHMEFVYLGYNRTPVDIVTGWAHSCAIFQDDNVICWGINGNGQLGIGNSDTIGNEANEMGDRLNVIDFGDTNVT